MKASTLDIPEPASEHIAISDAEQFRSQLDRLLQSASFRDTPSCRRLLHYIANRSLEGCQDSLKEFTIGIEVLGRRPDFDPKTDTIVRVQVRRLRQKIAKYYETEGHQDPVVITVPKGSYAVEFSLRDPGPENALLDRAGISPPYFEQAVEFDAAEREAPRFQRVGILQFLLLLGIALICGGAIGYHVAGAPHLNQASDPVVKLWTAMLKGDDSPIIGYPDAVFLLDGASDMFQFTEGPVGTRGELVDPNVARRFAANPALVASAGPMYYENGGYTGTGEIESVALLSVLLSRMGLHPKIVRSHEITVDDLRNHHVILLGGSSQNKAVRDFLPAGDFEYGYTPRAWGGKIVNHRPTKNEATLFQVERNPETHAVEGDYSLLSCLAGVGSSHHIIILGGLDTTGTLGATYFATSRQGAEKLAAGFENQFERPYFQALVHVVLAHGNQVLNVEPIAMHDKRVAR